MNAEVKLIELGLELPPAPKPVAVYVPALIVDRTLYVSGHGPMLADGSFITGRVGADLGTVQKRGQAPRQDVFLEHSRMFGSEPVPVFGPCPVLDVKAGYAAARQTGLAILATMRNVLGSLDRVRRVVKVLGMVNCTPDFREHPAVIDGCSELFADVFGPEVGIGVRSAVGLGSLPMNIAVEIEAIFEIR